MPGTQSPGEALAVYARQLAFEPYLQILRRHPQSLLLRLEPTRRHALENHVHRPPQLGLAVLINENWYKGSGFMLWRWPRDLEQDDFPSNRHLALNLCRMSGRKTGSHFWLDTLLAAF